MQEEFRVLLRNLFAAEGRNLSELSEQLKSELAEAIAPNVQAAERRQKNKKSPSRILRLMLESASTVPPCGGGRP